MFCGGDINIIPHNYAYYLGSVEEISMAFAEMDYLIKQKYNNDQSGYYNSNKTCDCVNVSANS